MSQMLGLLLAISSLLIIPSVLSSRYEWKEQWTIINNSSLQEFKAGQGYGSYRVIAVETPILSDKGTCALAFLNFRNSGNYFLSVMFGANLNASEMAVPIWTANRNSPVSEGASLRLRNLLLLFNAEGTAVWGPNKLMQGLELYDSGNLRLYDDRNSTIWQSFDSLTDVLMPNQKFRTGNMLRSNFNMSSMNEGPFSVLMETSGLVLYLESTRNGDSTKQPYGVYSILNGRTVSLQGALTPCPSYTAFMSYKGNNVTIAFEPSVPSSATNHSAPCSLPVSQQIPELASSAHDKLQFLRLEDNGDLVAYGYDPKQQNSSWLTHFKLLSLFPSPCTTPLACGAYGKCERAGNLTSCKCLNEESYQYGPESSKSCSAPLSLTPSTNCTDTYQQRFINMTGVQYFTSLWMPPDMTSSVDDCLNRCKTNCSCAALFYQNQSRGCYFIKEVLGSIPSINNSQLFAYLKVQDLTIKLPKTSPMTGHSWKPIVVGIAAGVLLLVAGFVTAVVIFMRRKSLADRKNIQSVVGALPGALVPQRFRYRSLNSATKGFSQRLGAGGFGSVYAGTLPNGTTLAVKTLDINASQGHKQFVAEVVSLASVSHVNIVKLRGYCVKGSKRLLVYEYLDNGSLDRWLFSGERQTVISWNVRKDIALGTARGLAYLHEECRDPILHLDIKPQNILLDDNFVAKVADFGMSKLLTNREITQVVTGVRGTPGYLAPEWLVNSLATKKCDVYSYGMVLLELVSGRKNLDTTKIESGTSWYFPLWAVEEVRDGRMINLADEKLKSMVPEVEIQRLVRVAFWCIQDNPVSRPSMGTVVQMLEGHSEIPEPPLIFHFSVQAPEIRTISTATTTESRPLESTFSSASAR